MSEEKQTAAMPSATDEYMKIFTEHLVRLGALSKQREDIDREIYKVTQMLAACYNMLSEQDQKKSSEAFSTVREFITRRDMGLTDAIRNILQSDPKHWFTPIQIRDRLQESGFDFSGYTSNPLSSVHSVLKRFKPEEVRTSDGIEGRRYQGIIMRFPRGTRRDAFIGRSGRVLVPLAGLGGLATKKEEERK
jgi:hypothetical protein